MELWNASSFHWLSSTVLSEAQYEKWNEREFNKRFKAQVEKLAHSNRAEDVATSRLGGFYLKQSQEDYKSSAPSEDLVCTVPSESGSQVESERYSTPSPKTTPESWLEVDDSSLKILTSHSLTTVTSYTTASSSNSGTDSHASSYYYEKCHDFAKQPSRPSHTELLGGHSLVESYAAWAVQNRLLALGLELSDTEVPEQEKDISYVKESNCSNSKPPKACSCLGDNMTGSGRYRTARSLSRTKSMKLNLERLGDMFEVTAKHLVHDLGVENPRIPGHDDITYRDLLEICHNKTPATTVDFTETRHANGLTVQTGFPISPTPLPSTIDPSKDGIDPPFRLHCWASHDPYYHRRYYCQHRGRGAFSIRYSDERPLEAMKTKPLDYFNRHPQFRDPGERRRIRRNTPVELPIPKSGDRSANMRIPGAVARATTEISTSCAIAESFELSLKIDPTPTAPFLSTAPQETESSKVAKLSSAVHPLCAKRLQSYQEGLHVERNFESESEEKISREALIFKKVPHYAKNLRKYPLSRLSTINEDENPNLDLEVCQPKTTKTSKPDAAEKLDSLETHLRRGAAKALLHKGSSLGEGYCSSRSPDSQPTQSKVRFSEPIVLGTKEDNLHHHSPILQAQDSPKLIHRTLMHNAVEVLVHG